MKIEKQRQRIVDKIQSITTISAKRRAEIIQKNFEKVPTNVHFVYENYGFGHKKILDIGSGFGNSLLYWGKNSEGVEIQREMVQVLKACGKKVHQINVEETLDKIGKEKFDGIYCSNLIEHLVAPHLFLLRLHSLLKKNGVLALAHPITPPFPLDWGWKQVFGYQGWMSVEHINFFTPKTIKLMLERSGFEVINQYNPGLLRHRRVMWLSQLIAPWGADILSMARKRTFRYSPKRRRGFTPGWAKDILGYHQ